MSKKQYWQLIRGLCILGVVMIHALDGYNMSSDTIFIILRQAINFSVAIFVFMSGFFIDVNYITSDDFNYRYWIKKRGGGAIAISLHNLVHDLLYKFNRGRNITRDRN